MKKYKWIHLHGQTVQVELCPPGDSFTNQPERRSSEPQNGRYERKIVARLPRVHLAVDEALEQLKHDVDADSGGHSKPKDYDESEMTALEGEIRHTKGSWAAGWRAK